jgi:hypothetical protein
MPTASANNRKNIVELQAELESLKKLRDSNLQFFAPEFLDHEISEVEEIIQTQLVETRQLLKE